MLEHVRVTTWCGESREGLHERRCIASFQLSTGHPAPAGHESSKPAIHAVQPLTAVQSEYSLWTRHPEAAVLPTCEELGIGFVPWSPLGQGYLTGKLDPTMTFDPVLDLRAGFPRFTPEGLRANRPVVDLLARIGAKKHATPAQIDLAWLLARKPWIVPIPGTRRLDHLDENLGAVNVSLTPDDLREIESGFSRITVHGARLSEQHMAWIDR